ncbi:hypothetical protein [uncultured Aquimarina sp.]|uniref:hypothetical protein n=1 Tax=uncultured Aquimarina sp. TaxID=575652 RepID=UPI00260891D2|nr:hypothetical protein [uncultured Aquimarina sp.]
MSTIEKSTRVNSDAILNTEKLVLSKTNINFCVKYIGDDMMVLTSRSKESDYVRQPSTVLLHADMPKAILKRFWVQLHSKRNTILINKNPIDDGGYYWVIIDFEAKLNKGDKTFSFFAKRISPSKQTIKEISRLYKKLLSIEQTMGLEVSEKYLTRFLKERNQTCDEYIKETVML